MRDIKFDAGPVTTIGDGVASVVGLENAMSDELVIFSKTKANVSVLNLYPNLVSIVLLGNNRNTLQGDAVERRDSIVSVPVSFELLGAIVDSLGNCLDGDKLSPVENELCLVDSKALGVVSRQPVKEALDNENLALDSVIRIGCGQRELTIVGDHQSIVLCQVYCVVYAVIGQKRATVAPSGQRLEKEGAHCDIVRSNSAMIETRHLLGVLSVDGEAVWVVGNKSKVTGFCLGKRLLKPQAVSSVGVFRKKGVYKEKAVYEKIEKVICKIWKKRISRYGRKN